MGNHPHVAWAQAWGRILKPRMQDSRDGVWWRERRGRVCAAGTVGGGIFAKTAKTPPLQSALVGRTLRPLPPIKRRGTPRRYVLREMELLD